MTTSLLERNGSTSPISTPTWLQQPTRQFFTQFNWDDHSPEVQQIQQAIASGSTEPLSLTLSVRQFFGAVNWENGAITPPQPDPTTPPNSPSNAFTLDEFSDLF